MTVIKNRDIPLKKRNRKLKSFTIIELLVTIMLSSLVVLITYTFYDILTKQYFIKKKFYQQINDITRLHLELQDEFDKSAYVKWELDKLYFIKASTETTCYQFMDSSIVRIKNNSTDTVYLKTENMKRTFLNKQIDYGKISELSFNIIYKKDYFAFDFYKVYSPDILMLENDEKN